MAAEAEVVPCVRCGSFVQRSECLYSDEGDPMCFACRETLDAHARDRRAARLVRGAGYGAAFMGVVGLPAALFFLLGAFFMSLPAVLGGWRALQLISREPKSRELLGWHYGPVVVGAVAGIILGVLGIGAMALQFFFLVWSRG